MNVVNIVILETNDDLIVELTEMLQVCGFQEIREVKSDKDLTESLASQEVDLAIIGLSFLQKNGKERVLNQFIVADIPFLCLYPAQIFGEENSSDNNYSFALIGEQFDADSLKQSIENQLFCQKKSEYSELRRRLLMDDHIFVKIGSQLEKINTSKILYVASDGNYSMVQTKERKYAVKISLKKMLESLPKEAFIRVHRGYLAQVNEISKVNIAENQIFIGGERLPLGRYYKSDVLSRLNRVG